MPKNKTINKKQMIAELAQQLPDLYQYQIEAVYDTIFANIKGHLQVCERVVIPSFGAFDLKVLHRQQYMIANQITKQQPIRYSPRFKASPVFKRVIASLPVIDDDRG